MEYTNTLSDHIIAFLLSAKSTKVYYRILRERAYKRANPNSFRTCMRRLEKAGYIKRERETISLTNKKYVQTVTRNIQILPSPSKDKLSSKLLICFDIPEYKRYARKWLRKQLKEFGYRMIQKSVWTGPGPLPKEFGEIVKALNIKDSIRVFKLTNQSK